MLSLWMRFLKSISRGKILHFLHFMYFCLINWLTGSDPGFLLPCFRSRAVLHVRSGLHAQQKACKAAQMKNISHLTSNHVQKSGLIFKSHF